MSSVRRFSESCPQVTFELNTDARSHIENVNTISENLSSRIKVSLMLERLTNFAL